MTPSCAGTTARLPWTRAAAPDGRLYQACQSGSLTASQDVLPALDAVKHAKGPVYALIAPAFLGQFSTVVTPGRLRSAFKLLGFTGMVEVALFIGGPADVEGGAGVLTEHSHGDSSSSGCCCPTYEIGTPVRKLYHGADATVPGGIL